MHPDDNPDARRAPTPSGRPAHGPAGDPRARPDAGPRGPIGPNTGGHQRPVGPPPGPGGRHPQSGPFTGPPRPQGPPQPGQYPAPPSFGPPSGRGPGPDPRQAPPTRAHPPQVLSGPAANSNAAYSLQNPDAGYGRDSYGPTDHSRTSTAGHEPDDSWHDDSEPDAMSAAPRNSTNVLAIVALVLSFLGLTSLFGVVCGHIARRQIRTTKEQGDSLAIASLWIGYFYIGAAVLCLIVYFWIRMQGA